MSKTRKTVTIDEELARIVDDHDEFNLSGFINSCLEQHFAGGDVASPETAALKAELEQIEARLQEAASKQDRLREERQRIEEQLEQQADNDPELLGQARAALDATPRDPDNPAVQNWAAKLGITADELIAELDPLEVTRDA